MDIYTIARERNLQLTMEDMERNAKTLGKNEKFYRRGINYAAEKRLKHRREYNREYRKRPEVIEATRRYEQTEKRKEQVRRYRKSTAGIMSKRGISERFRKNHPDRVNAASRRYYENHKDEPEFKERMHLIDAKTRYVRKAKKEGTYMKEEYKSIRSETNYVVDGTKNRAWLRVTGQEAQNPKIKRIVENIRKNGSDFDSVAFIARQLSKTY